jgi:hypothetical protein
MLLLALLDVLLLARREIPRSPQNDLGGPLPGQNGTGKGSSGL